MPATRDAVPDATLRLLLAPGVGPRTLARLREHFGDDEHAAGAKVGDLAQVKRIGRVTAEAIRRALDDADPASERALMRERGVSLVLDGDPGYPALLRSLPDRPAALWVRGTLSPEDRLAVAIVGSRRCTGYGREQAGRFATLLAECGLCIVSGGALGVDGEAHRGALRANGRTLAVIGCGLATDYPQEHAELFARIAAGGGAVISEHPMGAEPLSGHFPRRNRIISGLSLGVLVIEAARRSGALITARVAAEDHGREVMVLPGRIDSPASAGSLALLRDGGAALVLEHADVIRHLDASSQSVRQTLASAGVEGATERGSLFDETLSPGQQAILEALRDAGDPMHPDQLAARLERPLPELLADLTLLEIRGRIRKERGGVTIATSCKG